MVVGLTFPRRCELVQLPVEQGGPDGPGPWMEQLCLVGAGHWLGQWGQRSEPENAYGKNLMIHALE